jgi:hypothetical protein
LFTTRRRPGTGSSRRRSPSASAGWQWRPAEGHGFVEVKRTDGSDNEERAPDIQYVWSPEA